ncbi:DUF2497 domain-containing protein [Rhodopila sp.]|uniref:DUF2497 domain-containing protein n=1 Tax=Rhodopila sp. TaxID=2480087 RepID=UPI003D0F2B57
MEEILASIRRILNEEETPPGSEAAAPEETPAEDDVLLLDHSMLVAAPEPEIVASLPAALAAPAEPSDADPIIHEAPSAVSPVEPPTPSLPPASAPVAPSPTEGHTLLAPETAAAAALSVDGLLRSLAASRTAQVYRGGPTIEDVVREEVRPLLKGWLDTNLPPLVERLVRAEIERLVARAVP